MSSDAQGLPFVYERHRTGDRQHHARNARQSHVPAKHRRFVDAQCRPSWCRAVPSYARCDRRRRAAQDRSVSRRLSFPDDKALFHRRRQRRLLPVRRPVLIRVDHRRRSSQERLVTASDVYDQRIKHHARARQHHGGCRRPGRLLLHGRQRPVSYQCHNAQTRMQDKTAGGVNSYSRRKQYHLYRSHHHRPSRRGHADRCGKRRIRARDHDIPGRGESLPRHDTDRSENRSGVAFERRRHGDRQMDSVQTGRIETVRCDIRRLV